MADVAEIETALVNLIAAALYPTGTANSSAIAAPASIYRGWPSAADLDADIKAGRVNVTVFADPGMTRNTSRYWPETEQVATVAPTITATDSGAVVTLGGTVTAGNVVGVQFGGGVLATAYAYAALAGDTLTTVAAALAAKIPGATSTGPVLTMPSALDAAAVVMVPQPSATEVRRQDQGFRVSIWCSTPTQRDTVAGLIDNAFASLRDANGNFTRFLPIKQGEVAWIRYLRSYTVDTPTRSALWRRDLLYQIEYGTTLLELDPVMLFGAGTLGIE